MEELGDARLRAAQLKQYVAAALELVEKSEKRDHFYEVAANLIHGIPDVLFKLDKSLDAAAMAAARMDYEEIKQGLKPEKAEELERVLEDVRLHYLKRRSSVMNAKEASVCLDKFAQVTATEGRVPTADLARLIANLEQGQKTATSKDPSEFFREAAEYLRSTPNPSRRELVATLRRVLADALVAEDVEAGAGEEFKKVNPDISDEAVKKIDEMHEEHKDVVKDKEASDLEDACWEGYEAYGMKAGEGGQMVPNCVPVKTAANWKVAGWAEKDDAKGHRWMMDGKGEMIDAAHIHEVEGPGMPLYVLKFILKDGTALKDRTTYKKVQDAQKAALKWIKSDSEGASLIFQNFSKLATKESEEWKAARFEKGVPADPTENMSEEDSAEWKAMTDEHGDQFKTASNPKAEALEVMQQVMQAIEKHLGKDDMKEMFENPEAVKERGFPRLKLVQNKLVHVTFAIAEASKWDSPARQSQVTQLGLSDAKMSAEAGEWYTDQTDAVQNTMARQVLLAEAKKLGIKLDRAHTVYAASTDAWKA